MKFIYFAVNWILGSMLLLIGAFLLLIVLFAGGREPFVIGLSMVAMSLFFLPPSKKFFYLKTKKHLSTKYKILSLVLILFSSVLFSVQSERLKDQEQKQIKEEVESRKQEANRIKKEKSDNFHSNREQIISFSKNLLLEKKYELVVLELRQYLDLGDQDVNKIFSSANESLNEVAKDKRTKEILGELKSIPVEKYKKNNSLYEELVKLHPDNKVYRKKSAFYAKKVGEEARVQRREKHRSEKIEKQFSAWDGSHINLEYLIKQNMNDPDSYKHDETLYSDNGTDIIVKTTYRGKNAFGVMVRNSTKAKVDLDGNVLQIID
jgi:hypothetical protein